MSFDSISDNCPLLDKHNQLRDLILGLNPELEEHFGPFANIDVQPINPKSVEYKEVGLRWFVILPYPQIEGEKLTKLMKYIRDRIRSFETIVNAESFGCTQMVAGGAMVFIVGLREKQPAVK